MDNIVTYKSPGAWAAAESVFVAQSPDTLFIPERSQVLSTVVYALSLLCKIWPSQRETVFPLAATNGQTYHRLHLSYQ